MLKKFSREYSFIVEAGIVKDSSIKNKILSLKTLSILSVLFLFFSILPLCYLSFFNRATGDDLGYSASNRIVWLQSHSILCVLKNTITGIVSVWKSWQGTWFSVFLFSLQPEVFSDHAYVITIFIMLALYILTTYFLLMEWINHIFKVEKNISRILCVLWLILSIHFVPKPANMFFFWNGSVHYMVPLCMCQFLFFLVLRYVEKSRRWYMIGIFLLMTLLGGANYQAALLGCIIVFYGMIYCILVKKRNAWYLGLALLLNVIGLIISAISPGNKARAGMEFGFSVLRMLKTIASSFRYAILDVLSYWKNQNYIFIGFIGVTLILTVYFYNNSEKKIKCLGIISLLLFCMYCSMQAPEIYAGVSVSGGVAATNFFVFMIFLSMESVIISKQLAIKLIKYSPLRHGKQIILCLLLVLLLWGALGRHCIKNTVFYRCMVYIISGEASDYREQMIQQTNLLNDKTTDFVEVPFINDKQGPLMHMPITEDENAWTNQNAMHFYEKKRVVAIPRDEWNRKYGNN